VILDGVFNHCSSFHPWEDEGGLYGGAHRRGAEPYFRTAENGEKECWWGNRNLLKLNIDGCAALKEELLQIAEKWVSAPYDADGWRLDVAADVGHSPAANHAFWQEFRKRVKKAKPEALILAEHYGDPSEWLEGDEWDSVMNYDAFMDPVSWFLTGMEKHSDRYLPWMEGAGEVFCRTMEDKMAVLPRPALETALNQLDNHDHSRFLTRTNHMVGRIGELGTRASEEGTDKALLRAAVLLQMSWPGAPGIYYGDEVGVCGFTDPDNRRTFPWEGGDTELLDFYTNAVRLHGKYKALRSGSLRLLAGKEGLLAYGRFLEEERLLVLINQSEEEKKIAIDLRELDGLGSGCLVRLLQSTESGYNAGTVRESAPDGQIKRTLAPREAVLYRLAPCAEEMEKEI